MSIRLPDALTDPDDSLALQLLRRYYGDPYGCPGCAVGAAFDTWDSTGSRAADANRFTADDLVAVTFLSVHVPPLAAQALLRDRASVFADLLAELGPDRDLADETDVLHDGWVGWHLRKELLGLPGVGPTLATKLFARKRPRLRPIWDSVVSAVTGTAGQQWEPMRQALRENDLELHRRLSRLRRAAGLPAQVSALRILDVVCWREGKDRGL